MACEVVVTDEAKEDLEAAVLYLTESLGAPATAGDLLDAFDGFVAKVEAFPLMYPTARESRLAHLGYRKAALEGYLALYRVKGEKVYVATFFTRVRTTPGWCRDVPLSWTAILRNRTGPKLRNIE